MAIIVLQTWQTNEAYYAGSEPQGPECIFAILRYRYFLHLRPTGACTFSLHFDPLWSRVFMKPVQNLWKMVHIKESFAGGIQEVADRGARWRSLILAPWSKIEEWRLHPPPSVNLAPLKFSSLEPLRGAPAGAWMAPYLTCWFIFFFLFPFFPSFSCLFRSLFFTFSSLFLAPLQWPGGPRPPKLPPGYAPVFVQARSSYLASGMCT